MLKFDLNKETSGLKQAKYRVQQLKFFHTWVFYYFYCADQKFLKHIFKNKFTFVRTLFAGTLDQIYARPEYCDRIKSIYCHRQSQSHFNENYKNSYKDFLTDQKLLELYPYITPLMEVDGKLEMNWALIENIQDYVARKMMDIVFMFKPHKAIRATFNVDPANQMHLRRTLEKE